MGRHPREDRCSRDFSSAERRWAQPTESRALALLEVSMLSTALDSETVTRTIRTRAICTPSLTATRGSVPHFLNREMPGTTLRGDTCTTSPRRVRSTLSHELIHQPYHAPSCYDLSTASRR